MLFSWDKGDFARRRGARQAHLRPTQRIEHLPPEDHRSFYSSQRFTLNLTRGEMMKTGYAPSVRLFEAGACAVPVISDRWKGVEEFFVPGKEILIAEDSAEVLRYLRDFPEEERLALGERARARARVLGAHTAAHRAKELEDYLNQAG